jgi:hypothetical protein
MRRESVCDKTQHMYVSEWMSCDHTSVLVMLTSALASEQVNKSPDGQMYGAAERKNNF